MKFIKENASPKSYCGVRLLFQQSWNILFENWTVKVVWVNIKRYRNTFLFFCHQVITLDKTVALTRYCYNSHNQKCKGFTWREAKRLILSTLILIDLPDLTINLPAILFENGFNSKLNSPSELRIKVRRSSVKFIKLFANTSSKISLKELDPAASGIYNPKYLL